MSRFSFSGQAGPSRPASAVAAVVGLGMVLCVLAFFIAPGLGVMGFIVLWVCAALAIVGFHLWNAVSRKGVPVARFGAEGSGLAPERSDQAARLRELEKLRTDGLVTEEEYKRKRADILGEDW